MIKIDSLYKKFDEVTAINNLSLSLDKGIIGLVGHNGAGKSTLFRLISGVFKSDKGTILVNDIDNTKVQAKEQIFFLSDNPYVPMNKNARQIFDYYSTFFHFDLKKFVRLLSKFEIPTNRNVTYFSKGMKRQLFIILALSSTCPILLLDEAFDGLDPLTLEKVKEEIIDSSNDHHTIIISSHNISVLDRLCESFVILYKGQLGKEANAEDLGTNFYKYQALFKTNVEEKELVILGAEIISFKKVGSLVNFVVSNIIDENKIKETLNPILLEQISIDSNEIMALEMLMSKKRLGD